MAAKRESISGNLTPPWAASLAKFTSMFQIPERTYPVAERRLKFEVITPA
jgi:hypothetical protein